MLEILFIGRHPFTMSGYMSGAVVTVKIVSATEKACRISALQEEFSNTRDSSIEHKG